MYVDSSTNVCIEDCYISTGDDVIVIKSGWDEYGISFAHPSSNISIRHIIGQSGSGAGIAIGSEMSGGVSEVYAENLHFSNSLHGIRVKTSPGRGGYVRNLYISDVTMNNVNIAIRIQGQYGEHPDVEYDKNALPIISRITIKDVIGFNIGTAGMLAGIQGDNFSNICLSNVSLESVRSIPPWKCSNVEGYSNMVTPELCNALNQLPVQTTDCYENDVLEHQPQKSCAGRSRRLFLKLSSIE
jgi:polygalacturonase